MGKIMNKLNFYKIPGFKDFLINKHGEIYDLKNKCNVNIVDREYKVAKLSTGEIHLHRLLAITFVEKPDHLIDNEFDDLCVNHKDGDKHNNDLNNLEWVTTSENCIHAYKTGLRSDNTPILVKDLRNNLITRFYSLNECARYFKVNGSNIHWFLKKENYGKIIWNFYVFIKEGTEWPVIDISDCGKYRMGQSKPIIAISLTDKPNLIFESISVCANYFQIDPLKMMEWLRKNRLNELKDWSFKFVDDPTTIRDLEVIKREKTKKNGFRKPVPIKVTNLLNDEITYWHSSEEFAKILGKRKNTLQKYIWKNNGRFKNYLIEYLKI